jgi:hypothetical protein
MSVHHRVAVLLLLLTEEGTQWGGTDGGREGRRMVVRETPPNAMGPGLGVEESSESVGIPVAPCSPGTAG